MITFVLEDGFQIIEKKITGQQECDFFCRKEIFDDNSRFKISFCFFIVFYKIEKNGNCAGFSSYIMKTNEIVCVFLHFPATEDDDLWQKIISKYIVLFSAESLQKFRCLRIYKIYWRTWIYQGAFCVFSSFSRCSASCLLISEVIWLRSWMKVWMRSSCTIVSSVGATVPFECLHTSLKGSQYKLYLSIFNPLVPESLICVGYR